MKKEENKICRLFHDWDKWEVEHRKDLMEYRGCENKSVVVGEIIQQKRQCNRCGFTQFKRTVFDV